MVRGGRVRDCSVKPTARVGLQAGKARTCNEKPGPQATPMFINRSRIYLIINNLQSRHYKEIIYKIWFKLLYQMIMMLVIST
ncbi:MAG: hypothetical protein JWQ57_4381 [Mucilaginibacter sp.]|nr:hypothetical protein [Mucilaginibacter sp.]